MKPQTIVYYYFLFRKNLNLICVFLAIFSSLILLLLFSNNFNPLLKISVIILLIFLLIMEIIITLCWFIKYKKAFKQSQNKELIKRIKYSKISSIVLNSGIRIKYLVPKKQQEKDFFILIQPEIDKQKKLLSIIRNK